MKAVLDPCCGSRMWWFDKQHPGVVFGDRRAEVLGVEKSTLYNQISAGTCPVPTYVDGRKRYADHRDVADHFDRLRQKAA